ncbi:DNA ligase 1-like [Mytilus edulis]|uniref:DNA ligase 1-like n=1 Tax=Mytilus edulis TaxID=6550 RepID=UPI0039EF60E3
MKPVMKRTELPPPTCYIKTLLIKKVEDGFSAMKEMLSDSLAILEKQDSLTMESYVLSRMVYKMNSQWRREKSMQGLKRIKTCLNRYKDLKLFEYVAELKDHFDGCDLYLGEVYLPAQQMIVYLLRQMMCLARLMTQMCNYCKYTYVYISQNISIGNFIPQNMVFLSMVSRIWALGKSLGLHSARWYEGIYKCLDVFPQTQVQTGTVDLPSTLSSFLTIEEFQTDSPEDNISPSPADLSIDPDEDMDAQPEAQWEEDRTKKEIVETSKPEIFVKEKLLEKRSNVNNDMELSDSEDLGDVVVRQAPKSHTLSRDRKDHQIADDENVEDLGSLVSRKELPCNNCDNIDEKTLKQEIVNCKSFKKMKDILKQFDDFDENASHLKTCKNKLRELKKEHLLLKRNGFKDNQFIEQAKEELIKLINLSKDDKILGETHNEPCIKEDIVDITHHVSKNLSNTETLRKSEHRDFSIEEIFKKPYKNLLKLVEDQGVDTSSRKRQTKVKKCSVNVKMMRKKYMEESKKKKKKQYVKLAEEEVIELLNSFS